MFIYQRVKKTFIQLKSVALLCFTLLSTHAVAVDYLVVTADSVRVREAPNLQARSLTMLHKGHLVIKVSEAKEWTEIYFLGREDATGHTKGWMHSSFLVSDKTTD